MMYLELGGIIKEGMDADICIFDPETIRDRADFSDCTLRAEGLSYVIVGGAVGAPPVLLSVDKVFNSSNAASDFFACFSVCFHLK